MPAAGHVAPQSFQRHHQLGIGKFVRQLPDSVIWQIRHAAVGVDDGGQAVIHAVQHRCRSFATREFAQLHPGVGRRKVIAEGGSVCPAGDANTLTQTALAHLDGEFRRVIAMGVFADEHQHAPGIFRQIRGQPRIKQAMVQLVRPEQAETAHHKSVVVQLQPAARPGTIDIEGGCAQERNDGPILNRAVAVPLAGQPQGACGMHNHSLRTLKHIKIAWIAPYRFRSVRGMKVLLHCAIAMAPVQCVGQRAGPISRHIPIGCDMRQKKVVQHDDTRHLFQQTEHVLMEGRVAEMIEHPVIMIRVIPQPRGAAQRTVGLDPRVGHGVLRHDHVDIVVA